MTRYRHRRSAAQIQGTVLCAASDTRRYEYWKLRPHFHTNRDTTLRPLHQLCREERLYDVECWIAEEKPLQLAPEAIGKGTRPKTALQIALQTGQHSLATLLLKSGYRLEL